MNKIIFCDLNKDLVKKVKTGFKEWTNNTHSELIVSNLDLLKTKKKYKDALIVTASNPNFSMGGGLDKVIKDNYSEQCENPKEFKFTKDLFFTITCDENIKSSRDIIKRALLGCYFASRNKDIILTGLGTSIAGLSIDDFLEELKLFINADFSSANFWSADFSSANFSSADFRFANFSSANFSSADFRFANFGFANFSSANFGFANFSSANFSSADFRFANFSSANLIKTFFNFRILPEEGNIIGWKKTRNGIVKLEIDCKNAVGGMIGRKCRCKEAKVLEIKDFKGKNLKKDYSIYDKSFKYIVGKKVKVPDWNDKQYLECEAGIHFFITKLEAENY